MQSSTVAILAGLSLLPPASPRPGAAPIEAAPEDPCRGAAEAIQVGGVAACLEEVTFPSGPLTLAGQWFTPPGVGPFPGVVVIRGSGESSRGNRWTESLAAVLLDEGIGVLVPDKRGSGRSQGDWRRADFGDLADDALAGVRYLASRPEVTDGAIGLMGLSQGGMVAPVAAARSEAVAFVIDVVGSGVPLMESVRYEMLHAFREEGLEGETLAAATELLDAAARYARGETDWDAYERALEERRAILGERIVDAHFLTAPDHWRWAFFRRLADFDAEAWWRRVRQPTLVLLGERDTNTPTAASARRLRAAFEATGHSRAKVVVFPGLGHSLWRMSGPPGRHGLDPRVRRTLAGWVRSVAGGRGP